MKPYAKAFTLTDSIIQDNTVDCYQNPANEQNEQAKQQKTLENEMEGSDENGEDGKV